jgi:hypothetical protein
MIEFISNWLLLGVIITLIYELQTPGIEKTNESRIKMILIGPLLLLSFIVGFLIGLFKDVDDWFKNN